MDCANGDHKGMIDNGNGASSNNKRRRKQGLGMLGTEIERHVRPEKKVIEVRDTKREV